MPPLRQANDHQLGSIFHLLQMRKSRSWLESWKGRPTWDALSPATGWRRREVSDLPADNCGGIWAHRCEVIFTSLPEWLMAPVEKTHAVAAICAATSVIATEARNGFRPNRGFLEPGCRTFPGKCSSLVPDNELANQ